MNLKQHATAKDARAWVRQKLEEKHRFPGFGHRVYKTKDPRAKVLEPHVKKLLENRGESNLWKIYRAVEEEVESVLGPKGIHGNIDGVSGLLYYALGFPVRLLFHSTRTGDPDRMDGALPRIPVRRKNDRTGSDLYGMTKAQVLSQMMLHKELSFIIIPLFFKNRYIAREKER